jgi:hypothetical protein
MTFGVCAKLRWLVLMQQLLRTLRIHPDYIVQ